MGTTTLTKTPGVVGGSLQFGAEDVRRMMFDCYATEGIIGSSSFLVAQRALGANMSVDVAAGVGIVLGDTSVDQGKYYVRALTGANNVTVTAADLSNPRIDRLVLEVKDTDYDGSGLRAVRLRTVDGTPTAGANAATNTNGIAALPSSALEIARITVGTGVATIVTANIVDFRQIAQLTNAASIQAFTASGNILAIGGRTSTFIGAAGQTLTLPTAVVGAEYEVANLDTADNVTVARAGTDTFTGGATSVTVRFGMSAVFRCYTVGVWSVAWYNGEEMWRAVGSAGCQNGGAIGTQLITANGPITTVSGQIYGNTQGALVPFDPADYAVPGKKLYGRIVSTIMTNSVSPATTVTGGLARITAVTGAAGANVNATVGANVMDDGGQALTASAIFTKKGTPVDLSAFTAGVYGFTLGNAAGFTANAVAQHIHRLELRNV